MASINGLDTDLLNVSVLNANENIFIRGETGTQGQVISYDANRKIEFSDVVNDNDNIAVVLPLVKSIAGDPPVHTVSLGYNTSDFQLDGSNLLELKDTFVKKANKPLKIASDTIGLEFNTNDFQLDGSNLLKLKDTYVDTAAQPLSISGDTLTLGYNTNDFKLDIGNNLELKDTYVKNANEPLAINISGGYATIELEYNTSDFDVVSGELELKDTFVKTAVQPLQIVGSSIAIRLNGEDIIKNQGGYTQFAESRYTNTMYYDTSEEKYYKILKPSDFLNDDDSTGYARVVIRDFTQPGSMSCYAGTQFYCFFEIPTGFKFLGFRINLVNSAGAAQGTSPTTSLYVSVKRKSINTSFTDINDSGGTNRRGFNSANGGYSEEAIDIDDWELSDINQTYFYALHCFRSPAWSNAYYLQGGYLEFERI